jgi:uncharacterized DUF497 family protein
MTNDSHITINNLIATKNNVMHIARHGVTLEEVQQALEGGYATLPTYQERYKVIGATDAGRCVCVILAPTETPHHYQLVTARTADRQERRAYITHKLGEAA